MAHIPKSLLDFTPPPSKARDRKLLTDWLDWRDFWKSLNKTVRDELAQQYSRIREELPKRFPNAKLLVDLEVAIVRRALDKDQSIPHRFAATYTLSWFKDVGDPLRRRSSAPAFPTDAPVARVTDEPCLIQTSRHNLLVSSRSSLALKQQLMDAICFAGDHSNLLFLGVCSETKLPVLLDKVLSRCYRTRAYTTETEPVQATVTLPFVLETIFREFQCIVQTLRFANAEAVDTDRDQQYLSAEKQFEHQWTVLLATLQAARMLTRAQREELSAIVTYHERFDMAWLLGTKRKLRNGVITNAWYAHPAQPEIGVCHHMIKACPNAVRKFEQFFSEKFGQVLHFIGVTKLLNTRRYTPVFTCGDTQYIYNEFTECLHEVGKMSVNAESYHRQAFSIQDDDKRARSWNGKTATGQKTTHQLAGLYIDGNKVPVHSRNATDQAAALSFVNQRFGLNCVAFHGVLEVNQKSYMYFGDVHNRVVLMRDKKLWTLLIDGSVVAWDPHSVKPYGARDQDELNYEVVYDRASQQYFIKDSSDFADFYHNINE